MNALLAWLPVIWTAYKWAGLAVGLAVYLNTPAAPTGQRLLNAVLSAIGWPVILYRFLLAPKG